MTTPRPLISALLLLLTAPAVASTAQDIRDNLRALQHYRGGVELFEAARFKAAQREFDRALKLRDDHLDSRLMRGLCRLEVDDLSGALADFDAVTVAAPQLFAGWYNRGIVQLRRGEDDAAEHDLGRAIGITPDDGDAVHQRAIARYNRGRLEPAGADFDRAVELLPDDVDLRHNRACCNRDRGLFAAALSDLDRAIELAPKTARLWLARAEVQLDLDATAKAAANLDRALELDADCYPALLARARLRHEDHDLDGAIHDLNRALELDRSDPNSYGERGHARATAGDLRGAAEDFCRATALDPDDPSWSRDAALCNLAGDSAATAVTVLTKHPAATDLAAWRWLAAQRTGDRSAVQAALRPTRSPWWPAPILAYLRGELDAAGLAQAHGGDPLRRGEALFFTACQQRYRDEPGEALALLRPLLHSDGSLRLQRAVAAALARELGRELRVGATLGLSFAPTSEPAGSESTGSESTNRAAVITTVLADQAAAQAGLLVGDQVLAVADACSGARLEPRLCEQALIPGQVLRFELRRGQLLLRRLLIAR